MKLKRLKEDEQNEIFYLGKIKVGAIKLMVNYYCIECYLPGIVYPNEGKRYYKDRHTAAHILTSIISDWVDRAHNQYFNQNLNTDILPIFKLKDN